MEFIQFPLCHWHRFVAMIMECASSMCETIAGPPPSPLLLSLAVVSNKLNEKLTNWGIAQLINSLNNEKINGSDFVHCNKLPMLQYFNIRSAWMGDNVVLYVFNL